MFGISHADNKERLKIFESKAIPAQKTKGTVEELHWK